MVADRIHSIQEFIGYAGNSELRFSATSGGVGSALLNYLFDRGRVETAVSFSFSTEECRFVPRLIYGFAEYECSGSIYHDVDMVSFVKENLAKIRGGIALFALPCQVRPLRHILNKANIKNYIFSFACSGQMMIQGTWYYYKLLGIDKADVKTMRYRGNGWPGGISIELKNGERIFRSNYTSPWTLVHSSKLFQPRRCFFCKEVISEKADVSLADPWLEEYKDEREGKTLFIVNTILGADVVAESRRLKYISLESADKEMIYRSQESAFSRKSIAGRQSGLFRKIASLCNNRIYRRFVTRNIFLLKLHIRIIQKIYFISINKAGKTSGENQE